MDEVEERRAWMRVLAGASAQALGDAWSGWAPQPEVTAVRGPERGLVMVRGRIDAAGDRFNLGEATVCRATVRLSGAPLAESTVGTSYVLGGDLDHARLAAVFDGLLQDDDLRPRVRAQVVEPLAREQEAADRARQHAARSTQVDFFTVSREHA